MEKVKKCPFCGGTADLMFSGVQGASVWHGYIICKCNSCGCSGKGQFYHGEPIEIDLYDTVGGERAIDAWNRRVM